MSEPTPFESVNPTTGMLDDIADVRALSLTLIDLLKSLITSPLFRIIMPPGEFIDAATMIVISETLVRTISEADTLRLLARLMGMDPNHTEMRIREAGLSEIVPTTHPDAAVWAMKQEPLNPDDPLVKSSQVLQAAAELRKKKAERVTLSPGLEAFLKELQNPPEKG